MTRQIEFKHDVTKSTSKLTYALEQLRVAGKHTVLTLLGKFFNAQVQKVNCFHCSRSSLCVLDSHMLHTSTLDLRQDARWLHAISQTQN